MSRSAIKAGIDFSDYPEPVCKGEGDFEGFNYARGAQSLAEYFIAKFGINSRERFITGRDIKIAATTKTKLLNRKGIIFFMDIVGFRDGIGDHIDLWDGNQTTGGEYFSESMQVWFWEIKK